MGKQWKQWQTFFSWAPKLLQMVTASMKLKDACSFYFRSNNLKSYDQPRQHIKKQSHYFANKSLYSQSYGFSSSHVWMWELDHKEGWVLKNWCFSAVVLEKTLESSLDSKDIKPVNPKGNQPCIFTGKDRDAGKDWGQEEKRWQRMRWLDGITETRWFDEFEQTGR